MGRFRSAPLAVLAPVAVVALAASLVAVETQGSEPPRATTLTVVGRTLGAAQAMVRSADAAARIAVSRQVVEPSARPETVLSATSAHWPVLRVTIAVPAAAPCSAGQLSVSFTGVYDGASQHLYASFVVRDVSTRWCVLRLPIDVLGLDEAGAPVTSTASVTESSTPALDVLSPHTPAVPMTSTHGRRFGQLYPISVFWGFIGFKGPDVCAIQGPTTLPHVTPATWRITLPGTVVLTTPNGTPAPTPTTAGATHPTVVRPFGSCEGGITGTWGTVREGTGPRLGS